jgi:type I restriction enzyme S subunit
MPIQQEIFARGTGATVLGIKAKLLKQVPIFFPQEVSTQRKIAKAIEETLEMGQRLETIYQQKLDSLAELKQSILQKAFAGELTAQPEKALEEAVA